jgi:putative FmdB family regulatory protein
MPTYDYECPDCGHKFEEFQTMTAKPLKKCSKCGKRRVRRLIGSGLAPIFKGSGFYQTDYKPTKEPSESRPGAPAEPSAGAEGSGEAVKTPEKTGSTETAKADSKPTKPETKPAKKK